MIVNNVELNQGLIVQVSIWRFQFIACISEIEILPCFEIGNESGLHMQHSIVLAILG